MWNTPLVRGRNPKNGALRSTSYRARVIEYHASIHHSFDDTVISSELTPATRQSELEGLCHSQSGGRTWLYSSKPKLSKIPVSNYHYGQRPRHRLWHRRTGDILAVEAEGVRSRYCRESEATWRCWLESRDVPERVRQSSQVIVV